MTLAGRNRLRVVIHGAVQGVGFRPFIYRLATELALTGWVINDGNGVVLEVEGPVETLERFLVRIEPERPRLAIIASLEPTWLPPSGFNTFEIRHSQSNAAPTALVMPDLATCPDCLRELYDPSDRRYRYPFTNCTNCGPRFTIIEELPYDRPATTMRDFTMCEECLQEYTDPTNRRFHAQPNACPVCGPHVELWDRAGASLAKDDAALRAAEAAIVAGRIVAVKGIGGFLLMVDARNQEAVLRLRKRKHREEKPFALLYPNQEMLEFDCEVSNLELRAIRSPQSPIVLLHRKPDAASSLAPAVAPGNPMLGAMLPYAPLHHLLLHDLGFPVVATSGNLSDEPICIDSEDALMRLGGIADLFLVHDRPIARQADDSVVRIMAGRETVIRRARGYAPLPVSVATPIPPILATGANLKSAAAISVGRHIFLTQHIGDLETAAAFGAYRRAVADLMRFYRHVPAVVACDTHPDYLSSRYAQETGLRVAPCQHHLAHALSCLAENEIEPPALGVSFDGTGYGDDGTIWGGEFLRIGTDEYTRAAHMRTFRLPGGDRAVREPRRTAAGLLHAMLGPEALERRDLAPIASFQPQELSTIGKMLERGLNAPVTSSVGRLFDALASIVGLRQVCHFEGQAAMELEWSLVCHNDLEGYAFPVRAVEGEPAVVDWEPAFRSAIADVAAVQPIDAIAWRFHAGLAEAVVAVAQLVGLPNVALSGGCFQNAHLLDLCVHRLEVAGFAAIRHQRVPPNDGGIALGQVAAAARFTDWRS